MSIQAVSTVEPSFVRVPMRAHRFIQRRPEEPGASETFDWGELWQELIAGRYFLTTTHYVDDRCFATLERRSCPPPCARALLALERVLLGQQLKVPADDLGVGLVQISTLCSAALQAFSSERRASRAPVLVVMAAHASRGLQLPPARIEAAEFSRQLALSFEMPGACWRDVLTPCEWEVVRGALSGKRGNEIAIARGTSARTTANQLASAFRKLKLSGRIELRAKAVVATSRAMKPRGSETETRGDGGQRD